MTWLVAPYTRSVPRPFTSGSLFLSGVAGYYDFYLSCRFVSFYYFMARIQSFFHLDFVRRENLHWPCNEYIIFKGDVNIFSLFSFSSFYSANLKAVLHFSNGKTQRLRLFLLSTWLHPSDHRSVSHDAPLFWSRNDWYLITFLVFQHPKREPHTTHGFTSSLRIFY